VAVLGLAPVGVLVLSPRDHAAKDRLSAG